MSAGRAGRRSAVLRGVALAAALLVVLQPLALARGVCPVREAAAEVASEDRGCCEADEPAVAAPCCCDPADGAPEGAPCPCELRPAADEGSTPALPAPAEGPGAAVERGAHLSALTSAGPAAAPALEPPVPEASPPRSTRAPTVAARRLADGGVGVLLAHLAVARL